jgi:hypothetical protein
VNNNQCHSKVEIWVLHLPLLEKCLHKSHLGLMHQMWRQVAKKKWAENVAK